MKDADKMTKLLEAVKIVLEEVIPYFARKRRCPTVRRSAINHPNATYQLVRQEEMRQLKIIKCYQIKLDQVFMTLLWMGKLILSGMSQNDWKHHSDFKMHQKFSIFDELVFTANYILL